MIAQSRRNRRNNGKANPDNGGKIQNVAVMERGSRFEALSQEGVLNTDNGFGDIMERREIQKRSEVVKAPTRPSSGMGPSGSGGKFPRDARPSKPETNRSPIQNEALVAHVSPSSNMQRRASVVKHQGAGSNVVVVDSQKQGEGVVSRDAMEEDIAQINKNLQVSRVLGG